MGKTRNKNRSEIEYLNGKIRELESENRQLRKRLKHLDRQSHLYEDLVEAIAEEIKPEVEKCPQCTKGELKYHDLKHIKIKSCNECKYRQKI